MCTYFQNGSKFVKGIDRIMSGFLAFTRIPEGIDLPGSARNQMHSGQPRVWVLRIALGSP